MRFPAKFVCCIALYGSCATSFAAELGGAGLSPSHVRLAPLSSIIARAQLRGMRLREIRWDAVLHQSWAVLEDVDHPERPLWAELADLAGSEPVAASSFAGRSPESVPKPSVAVIHYGDRVRLWRNESSVRIEMSAIAEGSAAVGDEVTLRLPGSGISGDTGWRVTGVVRGPGDVEMDQ
jgi:hypothetical protein